eukprot:gene24436-biopygen23901
MERAESATRGNIILGHHEGWMKAPQNGVQKFGRIGVPPPAFATAGRVFVPAPHQALALMWCCSSFGLNYSLVPSISFAGPALARAAVHNAARDAAGGVLLETVLNKSRDSRWEDGRTIQIHPQHPHPRGPIARAAGPNGESASSARRAHFEFPKTPTPPPAPRHPSPPSTDPSHQRGAGVCTILRVLTSCARSRCGGGGGRLSVVRNPRSRKRFLYTELGRVAM